MRYNYECKTCKTTVTINKPMSDSSKEEFCPTCNRLLIRIYKIAVTTGDGFKS